MIILSKKLLFYNLAAKIPEETIIFENASPGNYTVEIPSKGLYEIMAVGGGGGSAGSGGGGKSNVSNNDPVNPINGA